MDEDGDNELEAIRRRRMMEIQQQAQQQVVAEQQAAAVSAQRQAVLRQILTPEARERLGRIELAYPEVAESVETQLIALAQSGRIQSAIDDHTLQEILRRVVPKKREIKIERR
ncbi:MAG TPA: DNA-binding protein [Thermoplasmata archaeon]|jgi:programmed cell death protein 5|nr:DNA-binding protein [Thermoplasmata archaeon]